MDNRQSRIAEQEADVIVIGGGPGGRTVARRVRIARPDWRVIVVKQDDINPNRCVIPYIYDNTVSIERGMIPNTLVTEVGAELMIGDVTALDPVAQTIMVNDEAYYYGKLVLATGSSPVIPPIAGFELDGIFTIRSRDDVTTLIAALGQAQTAVVIGMGLIGAEVACSLQRAGISVVGIDMLPHAMGSVLDDDYAAAAESAMRKHGIALRLNTAVDAFLGDGRVEAVQAGGERILADIVILAAGVNPETALAADAGAEIAHDGIVVDEQLNTSLPDVYALGDCVQTLSRVTQQPHPAKLGTTAVIQAHVVADQILGKDSRYAGTLASWACQLYDLPVGGVGPTPRQLAAAGIDAVIGNAQTMSKYPQMPGVQEVHARLFFAADTLRVLGGQLRGTMAIAGYLDLLALAIENKLTASDLTRLQYATHPELAPKPSDNLIVMAARAALK